MVCLHYPIVFRRHSGVPEDLIEEVSRRYAASVGSGGGGSTTGSIAGGSHDGSPFPTIHEASSRAELAAAGGGGHGASSAAKSRTLVERITELERRLPPHIERLKNGALGAGVVPPQPTFASPLGGGAHSNKSAPEGSLLNRVEVLEDAIEALVVAQEASLLYQQQLLDAQEAANVEAQQKAAAGGGCCSVM